MRKLSSFLLITFLLNVFISYGQNKGQKPATTSQKPASVSKPNVVSQKPSPPISNAFDPNMVGRAKGSYNIKVKITGLKKGQPIYLADIYGKNQYMRDTCFLNENAEGILKGNPKLQRGMYYIVFPTMDFYYEVIIGDDQEFTFIADTSKDETKIKIIGSEENEKFADYQKQRAAIGEKRFKLDNEYKAAKTTNNQELMNKLKEQLDTIDAQDKRWRDNYMNSNPTHLLTKFFKAYRTIQIPEHDAKIDSTFAYKYYKLNFWNNIDFTEPGIIRAPGGLVHHRLNEYFDKVVEQDPDSLIKEIDLFLAKLNPVSELYRYSVQTLTTKFQDKKLMCFDNITIHMINNIYCTGKTWWYTDTAGLRKMCEDAKRATPTMCGKIAPDLLMEDTAGKYHRLYENLGEYTILFFYDPTCGHCKEVIPIVHQVHQELKKYGITVYAVSTEGKYKEWREMMRQKPELSEWINVCKTNYYAPWPYRKYDYNINSNPQIFILDKNAKILAKRIDENQIKYFIESLLYEKGIIKVKPTPPVVEKKKTEGDEVAH